MQKAPRRSRSHPAQAPFVLERSVQTELVYILGPPFTPACQHDLFRVCREDIDSPGTEEVLGAYLNEYRVSQFFTC